jgi:hypothetical protein
MGAGRAHGQSERSTIRAADLEATAGTDATRGPVVPTPCLRMSKPRPILAIPFAGTTMSLASC